MPHVGSEMVWGGVGVWGAQPWAAECVRESGEVVTHRECTYDAILLVRRHPARPAHPSLLAHTTGPWCPCLSCAMCKPKKLQYGGHSTAMCFTAAPCAVPQCVQHVCVVVDTTIQDSHPRLHRSRAVVSCSRVRQVSGRITSCWP